MPAVPKPVPSEYSNIVLIGRTNAGKSTLFNRLTDAGHAIVSPLPNTTRDQNRALVHWKGYSANLIDTGGLDMSSYDPLDQAIRQQVEQALAGATAIIFVVDGQGDLMPQDIEGARFLQKIGKPVIVALNKADNMRQRQQAEATFSRLSFTESIPCSAKNGTGTAELLDSMFAAIPQQVTQLEERPAIQVALVGQPNVGKSTLFNAFLGESRVIVSPLPHTTRDPHDTLLEYNDRLYNVIDTAGMRRKTKVGSGKEGIIEILSVRGTKETISRADVVVCVIEASKRISHQDKAMFDYIKMKGKSFVLAINKWDLIPDKTPTTMNDYFKYYSQQFDFSPQTPIIFISALEHQRTTAILDLVQSVYDFQLHWMTQSELDGIVRQIMSRQPKERRQGFAAKPKRDLVIHTLKQYSVKPPRFILLTPRPKNVAPALIHAIEKSIRDRCPYDGVPIYLEVSQTMDTV